MTGPLTKSREPVFSFATATGIVAMAVLGGAGVLKLIDLPAFEATLRTWSLLPAALRLPVAFLVPTLEIGIAGFWLAGWQRVRMAWAAVLLLAVFSLAYAAQSYWAGAPTCGCFGLLSAHFERQNEAWMILTRNAVLILLLVPSLRTRWSQGVSSPPPVPAASTANARGGFTILELLLVISIIVVLISLSLPSLRSMRERSELVTLHARVAGHIAAFSSYTADFQDQWPFVTDPNATYTVVNTNVPPYRMALKFWEPQYNWHIALAEPLYRRAWTDKIFRARDRDGPARVSIWYSSAFLADPAFFTPDQRTGREQWRSTRLAEVRFPDKKVLFSCPWDHTIFRHPTDEPFLHRTFPFGFVDGAVLEIPWRTMRGGYPGGTDHWTPGAGNIGSWFPGTSTLGGVRGRDR